MARRAPAPRTSHPPSRARRGGGRPARRRVVGARRTSTRRRVGRRSAARDGNRDRRPGRSPRLLDTGRWPADRRTYTGRFGVDAGPTASTSHRSTVAGYVTATGPIGRSWSVTAALGQPDRSPAQVTVDELPRFRRGGDGRSWRVPGCSAKAARSSASLPTAPPPAPIEAATGSECLRLSRYGPSPPCHSTAPARAPAPELIGHLVERR